MNDDDIVYDRAPLAALLLFLTKEQQTERAYDASAAACVQRHSLRGSTGFTSIQILCCILLPCSFLSVYDPTVIKIWRFYISVKKVNKNLAIANRSRVSCAHNTLRASGIHITP